MFHQILLGNSVLIVHLFELVDAILFFINLIELEKFNLNKYKKIITWNRESITSNTLTNFNLMGVLPQH